MMGRSVLFVYVMGSVTPEKTKCMVVFCHQNALELNGIHQLLVYADDINLYGDSINTIKEQHRNLLRG
jgi:hypothetical protein